MKSGIAPPLSPRGDASPDAPEITGRIAGDLTALDDFARELRAHTGAARAEGRTPQLPLRRINADESTGERDLARLVLALVDLVRRLMERHAVRRVNAGSLTDEQVERMGETFLKLDQRMTQLCASFGLDVDDLNICLGPLGDLMPREPARTRGVAMQQSPTLPEQRQGAEWQ